MQGGHLTGAVGLEIELGSRALDELDVLAQGIREVTDEFVELGIVDPRELDARLELGDEAAAETAYRSALAEVGAVPAIRSRLARIEAITGDPVAARDLARAALVDAAEIDLRPADAAFYWFQLGAYEFAIGETEAADRIRAACADPDTLTGSTSEIGDQVVARL